MILIALAVALMWFGITWLAGLPLAWMIGISAGTFFFALGALALCKAAGKEAQP